MNFLARCDDIQSKLPGAPQSIAPAWVNEQYLTNVLLKINAKVCYCMSFFLLANAFFLLLSAIYGGVSAKVL